MRDAGIHKEQLHSQLDDFTVDVACNRIARATAEHLASSPLVDERLRTEFRRTLASFADVKVVPITPALFDAAAATSEYGPLLDLCRLVLDGVGINEKAGTWSAPAFLLDMEQVFERYVTRGVVEAFVGSAQHSVAVQQTYSFHQPIAGRPDLLMRPDVTIERGGRPSLLVDAKWKRPARGHVPTADVYQMLAYAAGLGVGRVVLVYPGKRDRGWHYVLVQAPVRVEVRTLRVTGTAEECRRSLRRLGQLLRKPP
jgi:5-methylcytosine-specific restriction enzyme subunit McrC